MGRKRRASITVGSGPPLTKTLGCIEMASSRLRIHGTQLAKKLVVEPWAMELELGMGLQYDLVATALDEPWFEVESVEYGFIVYVNGTSAVFEVFLGDKKVCECPIPTPSLSGRNAT
jgi:hypothetical protein